MICAPTPQANFVAHIENDNMSIAWILNNGEPHHVVVDLEIYILHSSFTSFDNIIIKDDLNLSISQKVPLHLPLKLITLHNNVLSVLIMKK